MLTIAITIAAIIIVIILLFLLIWRIRARRFKPNPNKLAQQSQLNSDLEPAGFAYDLQGDYFYSLMNCWQRSMGYCRLYDEGAPLFNMVMDCEPITFSYAGKRWLIELWKGQYGITTGGEIGIYNTNQADIISEKFTGTFYENIRNEEMMPISFILRKNGKEVLRRSELHWWLTGFKLGQFSSPDSLTMEAKITFPNREMCNAFIEGLRNAGYQRKEFSSHRTTVTIQYTKPHTTQPLSRNKVQDAIVQQTNENNCKLLEFAIPNHLDTLDQMEFIKTTMPELYHLFLHSLYAKGFFEAFDWIIEIIRNHRPDPVPPVPPCPVPEPCPECHPVCHPCPPRCTPPCLPRCSLPCPPKCHPCPPRHHGTYPPRHHIDCNQENCGTQTDNYRE